MHSTHAERPSIVTISELEIHRALDAVLRNKGYDDECKARFLFHELLHQLFE